MADLGESAELAALRRGDEDAFAVLVRRHHREMRRVAALFLPDSSLAEEAIQETWLAVLRGLERFEGRSSLKTWLFRILVNRCRSLAKRARWTVPLDHLEGDPEAGATVDPRRFRGPRPPATAGHWQIHPAPFPASAEQRALAAELRQVIDRAVEELPPAQRAVLSLRDLGGWSAAEVCNVLGISETNQRVRLHRARAALRRALEAYFGRS